ncbi:MAG: hypothetical protein JXA25_13245 [Anaerolineales bacterium]|nr:hypothetical protein [Anaerolineales bacterium]
MFKRRVLIISLLVLGILASACGGGTTGGAGSADAVQADTDIQEVDAVSAAAVEEEPAAEDTSEGSEESESAEEIPVTGAEIQHQVFPDTFMLASLQRVIDCNTGRRAANEADPIVAPECDQWDLNRYERPLDNGDGYMAAVDILTTELGQDEDWLYAQISFFKLGEDAPVLNGSYALEIDLNLDARGDLIVLVNNPAAMEPGEWGVAGVQVWQDTNEDIGAQTAVLPDGGTAGDGFETLLFDAGKGEDPDLAWARVNPENPNVVELSFKKSLLGGQGVFAWWSWASAEPFDLAAFDYDDTYGEDGLTGLDNTCAWMFGQAPIEMPNICHAIVVPTAEPGRRGGGDSCSPPPGGCPPQHIWIETECACILYN